MRNRRRGMTTEKIEKDVIGTTDTFHTLVDKTVDTNLKSFGISLLNLVAVQRTPIDIAQTVMEGVDTILPKPLKRANDADRRGKKERAIALRSVTNVAHIGAGSVGVYGALSLWDESVEYTPRYLVSMGISLLVGFWNVKLLGTLREQHQLKSQKYHEPVLLDPEMVSHPQTVQNVMLEKHHIHPNISKRNINNLEMCMKTNIVEAIPAFLGPIAQLGWEHGSAATVAVASGAVIGMAGVQVVRDAFELTRHQHDNSL